MSHHGALSPGPGGHRGVRTSRRVRLVLTVALAALGLATVAGLVALWPRTDTTTTIESLPPGGAFVRVQVTAVDPTDALAPVTGTVRGTEDLVVDVHVPPEIVPEVAVGDRLVVMALPEDVGAPVGHIFVDFDRDAPLALLAVLYAVVVVLVARWRGLAALAGLAVSFAILAVFTLPALLEGAPAAGVALVTAALVMLAVLYLAHGVSARTSTALLGTLAGIAVTTALAAWSTGAARLTGLTGEHGIQLAQYAPQVQLRGVLLCGIVLAGIGVLNDVTITQASAVWELHGSDPAANRRALFSRAMRIGRDHIASTVYTIAFAYIGAALPLILLMSLSDRSLLGMLTAGEIAEEIVRTLVGSVGLVLAIPATTAIAVVVATSGTRRGDGQPTSSSPPPQPAPS